MKHFKNVKSYEDLKSQYKKLAISNHPDNGGNDETMKLINAEYDLLFPIWKTKKVNKTGQDVKETAYSTRSEFYTQNGWKGENYSIYLSTTEIAKRLRTYVKELYPTWKFSITTETYSGGATIHVSLMEAPYYIFNNDAIKKDTCWNLDKDNIYIQLHHVRDNQKPFFIESAFIIMQDVFNQLQSYNFDDSDSQIDYFHTNFYTRFNIGKWDKGFKVVEKTARIKQEKKKDTTAEEKTNNAITTYIYTYTVKEDVDTRDNGKLYLVKVEEKLSTDEYISVNNFIKSIGGYYSKFKHAFIFKENPSLQLGL